jgi:SPP1 family predicted phage head-tail adaptor
MRAGNLRVKAIIQEIAETLGDFGMVEGWADLKTVYCSITPISGKESFLSNSDFSKVSHKIKIRYTDGINASQRLNWNGRIFDFVYPRNIGERNKEIEILAEEVVNG